MRLCKAIDIINNADPIELSITRTHAVRAARSVTRSPAAWHEHVATGGRATGTSADPWDTAIMDRLAVENPWALQVIEALMPDMWLQLPYWTNTVTPGQTCRPSNQT